MIWIRSIERNIEVWWSWWFWFNPFLGSVSILLTPGCSWPTKFLLTTLTGMYADNMFVGCFYAIFAYFYPCLLAYLFDWIGLHYYLYPSFYCPSTSPSIPSWSIIIFPLIIHLIIHPLSPILFHRSIYPFFLSTSIPHLSPHPSIPHHSSPLHHNCCSVPSSHIIISIYLIHSVDSYDNAVGTPSTTPTWS